jgi:Protein of unknown function (DUF2889)
MPLSEPADRELLHRRDIAIRGYRRGDGLFDIDAELTDSKTYGFDVGDRGALAPGDKLHNMLLRLTVDAQLTIVASEAVTEAAPFSVCPGGAASFSRLAGLRISPGFLREALARIGGVAGCTHIREVLQQMATVAFQTTFEARAKQIGDARVAERMVNSCHAYAATGEVVRRRWPQLYSAPAADTAAAL